MFLIAFLLGCEPVDAPADCTTEARASVTLTVVDAEGAAVPAAVVTWEADGGEQSSCDPIGDSYACGWEVAGTLAIRVEAPGFEPWVHTVEVAHDGCHVLGENLTASLQPAEPPCDVALPAVRAIVLGSEGEALAGVSVQWSDPATDGVPRDCLPDGLDETVHWCDGWIGDVEVWAIADGHGEERAVVAVAGDACGPVTEDVALELSWLPDQA